MANVERPGIEIVDVEKVLLSVSPKDEDGRDIPADQVLWVSSDEGVVTLVDGDTGLSKWAVSGAPGVATITVVSGELSESMTVTVKFGAPQSLNLSAGTPVHE